VRALHERTSFTSAFYLILSLQMARFQGRRSPGYAKRSEKHTKAAPMDDVGWKDVDETRTGIRLVGARGAKGMLIHVYHYFVAGYPEEKMQAVAEELGGKWE
jgi:hypothetical protein